MSRRVKRKAQDLTVAEFKQWLSGVEDMQPDGWFPNESQWKKIRAKINCLVDEPYETIQEISPPAPIYRSPSMVDAPARASAIPQQSLGDEIWFPKADPTDQAANMSGLHDYNTKQFD